MRLLSPLVALLTALAFPSAALADDYFTYIPLVGDTVTFTLTSSEIFNVSPYYAVQYGPITYSNGTKGGVNFFSPSFSLFYDGVSADISLGGAESSSGAGDAFGANLEGPQLFSNNIGADVNFVPIFIPGVYELTQYPAFETPHSAILCIDTACNVAPTPTPEPSSIYLLGSGALGLLGVAQRLRRRI